MAHIALLQLLETKLQSSILSADRNRKESPVPQSAEGHRFAQQSGADTRNILSWEPRTHLRAGQQHHRASHGCSHTGGANQIRFYSASASLLSACQAAEHSSAHTAQIPHCTHRRLKHCFTPSTVAVTAGRTSTAGAVLECFAESEEMPLVPRFIEAGRAVSTDRSHHVQA